MRYTGAMDDDLAARALALDWLEMVLARRRTLDDAIAELTGAALAERDRAFARALAACVLRRLGQIDALIGRCLESPRAAGARAARALLRLGAAQLLFLDTPPHAAVDTTVRLARARGLDALTGLINGVLRRLARDGAAWRDAQDAARLNTPDWMWRSWTAAYGERPARAIAAAHLDEPPLDLTPKRGAQAAALARRLDAKVLATGGLRLAARARIESLAGYGEGEWWVQDAAAAQPARLLAPVAGRRVIELCAAPGGKTAQFAAAGADVVAVDRSSPRLELLAANLRRLGLTAETVCADAGRWRPQRPAELVLLDAPCTGTGTIRRHPDILRLRRAEDVARQAALQRRLLDNAAAMLAPGGLLVYAVCSLEPEEGPELVEGLLAGGAPFERVRIEAGEVGGLTELVSPAGDLRTLPCHLADQGGLDGFYAARLKRLA